MSLTLGPITAAHGFPWATFTANVLGSLGLGLVFVLAEDRSWFGADLRLLLGTGVFAPGDYAWLVLGLLIVFGGKLIWWGTEAIWGKYENSGGSP